jgi:hypothetical protein
MSPTLTVSEIWNDNTDTIPRRDNDGPQTGFKTRRERS